MRSREEILFRLRQEGCNLRLWLRPPGQVQRPVTPLPRLPRPECAAEAVRGTEWAENVVGLAEAVLGHRIPLFDRFVDAGPNIEWRRDYMRGITSELRYFRRVPYLDATQVGDHKNVWELNRHQHLVLLAQAHLLTGRTEFLAELWAQLDSWLAQNPFAEGINWASALEIAFRVLSWAWIWHLAGAHMPVDLGPRFLTSLYQHGLFLENNFSVYFSPNTHLLGEAVALHALGVLFSNWPAAARWREYGGRWVRNELDRQVRPDGMHFEQSTYYHVYALDMFLFHALLEDVDRHYRQRLRSMADVLALLLGARGAIPFLGDDDGGRFFHPYGPRNQFGRATLLTYARMEGRGVSQPQLEGVQHDQSTWWLGPGSAQQPSEPLPAIKHLPNAGLVVWNTPDVQIVLDAGGFGAGSAGHSHADALSLVVSTTGEEILIDPGTYTYVGDPAQRELFRSSVMHNTLHVPGREQATPAGPFRWRDLPAVSGMVDERGVACFSCQVQGGYRHTRRVCFLEPSLIVVVDSTGAPDATISWHLGAPLSLLSPACARIGNRARLVSSSPLEPHESWRSPVYGTRVPIQALSAAVNLTTATVIDLAGIAQSVSVAAKADRFEVLIDGGIAVLL